MSRSYRKNVFDSTVCYSRKAMKAWRTQENRRLRHKAKQLINTCLDYDALIIPVLNDFDTLWGSPRDGANHIIPLPALNECEIRLHRLVMSHGPRVYRWYTYKDGHFKYCYCYSNKKSYYWKAKRK